MTQITTIPCHLGTWAVGNLWPGRAMFLPPFQDASVEFHDVFGVCSWLNVAFSPHHPTLPLHHTLTFTAFTAFALTASTACFSHISVRPHTRLSRPKFRDKSSSAFDYKSCQFLSEISRDLSLGFLSSDIELHTTQH